MPGRFSWKQSNSPIEPPILRTNCTSHSTGALNALFEVVAGTLGVKGDDLEASGGEIRQTDKPENKSAWKEACSQLGLNPITKRGVSVPGESAKLGFNSGGGGGAQMADV